MTVLNIKNMVCPRCVMAVRSTLEAQGLTVAGVSLGEATLGEDITDVQREKLRSALAALGFELLDDPTAALVEKVRTLVIEWVRMHGEHPRLSDYIQSATLKDYSALSRLFSATRGMTIERYAAMQRVERVKELLCYSEKTVSEIAYETGYSSLAHLSAQFKQLTGMSPKAFQQQSGHQTATGRRFIDGI